MLIRDSLSTLATRSARFIGSKSSHGVALCEKRYTLDMPTTKPRYAITETPDVSRALEAARRKRPEDSDRPAKLILHLIHDAASRIDDQLEQDRERRLQAIRDAAGSFEYPEVYLEDLRKDWPE